MIRHNWIKFLSDGTIIPLLQVIYIRVALNSRPSVSGFLLVTFKDRNRKFQHNDKKILSFECDSFAF